MMHNLRKMLVLLSLFAWVPAHAGFLDKLFGSASESSPAVSSQNPAVYTIRLLPASIATNVSDYRLGAGDKLAITVFNEKELSMELRLSDAGSFLYPFLGEVVVKNKTIGDLQAYINRTFKRRLFG
jgi:protein involved in polysaccharide export with SLBB domain